MATRFYLRKTAESTGISPTPDSSWEDTSNLARAQLRTASSSDALGNVSIPDDGDATNKDILIFQYVSDALTAGQTFTGGQAYEIQVQAYEEDSANNLFLTIGLRIIASDGSTVRKTAIAVVRDATEVSSIIGTPQNRRLSGTTAATNYTTQSGDRLVLEIGLGGDPSAAGVHEGTVRLGDNGASDLPEDDTNTETTRNPWFELTDTLTFGGGGGGGGSATGAGLLLAAFAKLAAV